MIVGDAESFSYDENGLHNEEAAKLTGVEGIATRSSLEAVMVRQGNKTFSFEPYRPGHSLKPAKGTDVIASYSDGDSAFVEHRIGAGKVISCGAPLFDMYSAGIRQLEREKPSRYKLLRYWRESAGVRDDSWVFDVTLDNLSEVTGLTNSALRPVDDSVRFAPFMYVHGIEETVL